MNYNFALSLRMHLEQLTKINDVVLMRDGVTISDRPKPFLTVKYLQDNNELLAAGRKDYEEIYRYQIGLYASNIGERYKLEETVKTHIRTPEGVPLYDDDFNVTGKTFHCEVDGFTAISNTGTPEDTTNSHRGYFDVSITIYRETGNEEFTQ